MFGRGGCSPLEEAIRKMTSLPAQRLGLYDRALILPGMWADILIFNPERVEDKTDFTPSEAAMRYPKGIEHLLVHGAPTIREGEHTGARAGKVLKRFRPPP